MVSSSVCVCVRVCRISFLLTGLMPYTLYQVIVAGTTGAGTGNFSDPVDERTLSDGESVCKEVDHTH